MWERMEKDSDKKGLGKEMKEKLKIEEIRTNRNKAHNETLE